MTFAVGDTQRALRMSDNDWPGRHGGALNGLPPALAVRVESELSKDERLVWVGQPRPDLYARASGCLVVVGVFFTGFASLWLLITFGSGFLLVGAGGGMGFAGIPFFLFGMFGLLFLAIGVGLLTAPIWTRKLAKKAVYALTDRRAITWEPSLFGQRTVRSYNRAGLGRITRQENADGSGSLIFLEYTTSDSEGTTTHQRGFMYIDDVRVVEDLLRRTLLE